MLRTIGLMSGTSLDGVDAAWLETDGERIGAFGPTLTLPYDEQAARRPAADPGPGAEPGPGRSAAEKRGGAADRVPRPRGGRARATGGPDRLPRPDHPAPAGSATDLAGGRRRRTRPAHRHTGGPRLPLGGRGGGRPGRAARAGVSRRAGARCGEAAGGAEHRRRGERDVDRRGRRAGRVRHRPRQRSAGRLDRAPGRSRVRPRRRDRAVRAGRCGGAEPAAGRPVFLAPAAEIARPAGLRRLARREPARGPVASRWRGDPGCVHRRRRRPRPTAGDTAALVGHRRRAAQSGNHGGAARQAGCAGRTGRGAGLGRRCDRGAVLRLPRRAHPRRAADQLPRHDRRSAADDRRAG